MVTVLSIYTVMIVIVIEVQENDLLSIIDGGYNFIDVVVDTLIGAFGSIELDDVLFQNQSLLASCKLCNIIITERLRERQSLLTLVAIQ